VWITHAPDLPADDVALLAELVELDREYVLVSPYEGLPSPVVVSTWGHQLQVDAADDPRVRAFVEQFAGGDQGGSPGRPAARAASRPEQDARDARRGRDRRRGHREPGWRPGRGRCLRVRGGPAGWRSAR
jgi:hypothetical protein